MMRGHEIFDSWTNRRAVVDHAFIVAGGEITKQAKNWLGGKPDATKRSQVMFMDRDDILNLFIVTNLPLPEARWTRRRLRMTLTMRYRSRSRALQAPRQIALYSANRFVRERPETAAMSNSFFAPKLTPKLTPSCQFT
jgi:hypothetical protein